MMNWAEYEEEEKPAERCFWREVACALLIGATLAVILGPMVGCATMEPESRVCFMKLMGRTEGGLSVVATHCMTQEQFAESQK